MKSLRSFLVLAILAVGAFACSQSPTGTKENPFRIMFVPYVESQTITTHTDGLVDFLRKSLSQKLLGKDEGFYIKASIPTSYVAVVEAFGTKRADLSSLTTFSYILAHDIKKYPTEAILSVDRYPDGMVYKGAIIARADSPIKRIEDLQGKKFAFSDPASTSGFILPSKLFKDKNIKLSESVFAGRHDNVVMMVHQKQVDAGAIYYSSPEIRNVNGKKQSFIRDARSLVSTQIPDVEKKIKIIGFTQEVPNEPWVLRSNIYSDPVQQANLKKAIQESIMEYVETPAGKELMQTLVRAEKVVPVTDAAYDGVRSILVELGIEAEKFVK